MLFHTHLLLGILFFLLAMPFLEVEPTAILFFMALLGSIFPDIDEGSSRISRWAGIFGKIINFFFKHRGFFHSLPAGGIAMLLLGHFLGWPLGVAFLLGFCAHLIGDSLTPRGIQPLSPFSSWKIQGPIRTGGFLEIGLILLLILAILQQFW